MHAREGLARPAARESLRAWQDRPGGLSSRRLRSALATAPVLFAHVVVAVTKTSITVAENK